MHSISRAHIIPLLFFTVYFSLLTFQTKAQDIDSLIAIMTDRSFDNLQRFDALQDIMHNSWDQKRNIVLESTEKLRLRAIEEKNMELLGDVLLIQGRATHNYVSKEQTLEKYLECYKIYKSLNDTISMVYALNMIALTYDAKKEMRYRLRYLLTAIEVGGDDPNNSALSAAHANLGETYRNSGENEKALQHLLLSVRYMRHIEELGGKDVLINLGTVYFMISDIYIDLEEFEKADSCIAWAEDYYINGKDVGATMHANTRRGNLSRAKKEYDKALQFYRIATEANIELGGYGWDEYDHLLLNQANVYRKMGGYRQAIALCNQIETENLITLKDKYESLYLCYKALGNNQKALSYIEVLKGYEDQINKQVLEESQKQMAFHLEMLSDSAEHVEEIRLTNEANEAEIYKQKQTRNWSLAGGVLALILAIGFYSRWQYVRRSRDIISKERGRSESLLLNILPEEIAKELKEKGRADARNFDQVTILFTDFKQFTQASENLSAMELVEEINTCFETFDQICEEHEVEKIKTIGDAYMAAGGLPVPSEDSVRNTVLAGIKMAEFIVNRKKQMEKEGRRAFEMRVGINTGPVVAGIVGVKKFQYDIWGDTVNTASRMESAGEVGRVNISQTTYDLIKDDPRLRFESRGKVQAKGKGEVNMYFARLP
jgi:adenylate cyclase